MISLVIVYVGLGALAPVLALAQRLAPAAQGVPHAFTSRRRLDWLYWLVTPLGAGLAARAIVVASGALVVLSLGGVVTDADDVLDFFAERSLLRALPGPAQLGLVLVLADLLGYVSHRLRHHRLFFPIHAVHHSARELDWLAAARMHPLDEILDNVAVTLPILALGPAPWVLLSVGPITLLYTLVTHAAVRASLGPLGHVLVSPDFHRRHHAVDGPSANYAGMFSVWDRLFGTYAVPEASSSALRFGVAGAPFGDGVSGQLVEPLVRVVRAGRPDGG